MKYYSEEIVKKIIAHAEYNGTFCIQEPINLETYSSIELPDKYGDLIERDKLLEWQNITYVDTGMWQTDYDAVKTSVIKSAPVVVKGQDSIGG